MIFTEAARPRCISLLRVDKPLCLPKLESIFVLLSDFSTMNESFSAFSFVVGSSLSLKF